jgi:hypothetical protein
MRPLHDASRQALFDLILSGVRKQMRAGDSFGVWTFNEATNFDYPKQDWNADRAFELASRAAIFLQRQRCEKQANLDQLIEKLESIIKAVKDVNILLITCGEPPMRGTSFDALVNAEYTRRTSERKKAQKPFVTTIVARQGRIAGAGVTLVGEEIVLPRRPMTIAARTASAAPADAVPPKASVPRIAQNLGAVAQTPTTLASATNLGPKQETEPKFAAAAAPAPPITNSLSMQRTTSAVPSTITASMPAPIPGKTSSAEPVSKAPSAPPADMNDASSGTAARSALPRTKVVPPPTALPELKLATPAVDVAQAELASNAATLPENPKPLVAESEAKPAPLLPGQLIVSARMRSPAPPAGSPTPIVPLPLNGGMLLWTGIGLLAVAVVLLLILIRRARAPSHGSIISRSFDR